jgi:hypothetical protein
VVLPTPITPSMATYMVGSGKGCVKDTIKR